MSSDAARIIQIGQQWTAPVPSPGLSADGNGEHDKNGDENDHNAKTDPKVESGHEQDKSDKEQNTQSSNDDANDEERRKAHPSKLGETILDLIERYPPAAEPPNWGSDRFDSTVWRWGEPDPVNATDKLTLNDTDLAAMREAHAGFVNAVNTELPRYVSLRYDAALGMVEDAAASSNGTPRRGIVVVGGGKYNVIMSVSLRFLRRTGTTLPVEVFVTESEYEAEICEEFLPTLNAHCRIYPKLHKPIDKGFQLKAFALLFSSFDEILFLDADNTAMRDVAPLFDSPPFQQTGLVTWPDFWQTTVSPLYYEVSGLAPVPVSARPSSETGQLLVDKARHWKTLLLVAYYNFYGPTVYYRLLNQGFTGMGDKETILPAAAVFGLPAYQVHIPIEKVGHRFEDNSTGGRVMMQYDAGEDWVLTQLLASDSAEALQDANGQPVAKPSTEKAWKALYHERVRPVFLHTNWPKWDPTEMLGHISKWSDMTTGVDGKPEPAFHYPQELAVEIKGTERMLWEEAQWLACHKSTSFRHWRNNGRAVHACERLKKHFQVVFDTEIGRQIGLSADDVLFPKLHDEYDDEE